MKKWIFIFLFSCIFVACENKETHKTEVEALNFDEQEVIVLDNGKKWVIVPEMMAFIKNIENLVIESSAKGTLTFEDYQELSKHVEQNLNELVSNCTMTGQAHDELHKWLVPFLDLSASFSKCTSRQESEEIYLKIKEAFIQFNIYFE